MSTTMWIIAGVIIGIEVIALIAIVIALGKASTGTTRTYSTTQNPYPAAPQPGYGQPPQQPGGFPAQQAGGYPAAPQSGGYPPQSPGGFPAVGGESPPSFPPQT